MDSECREKSLESTEVFKIFGGAYPRTPLASRAFGARYFTLNILCLRTPFNETQLRAWSKLDCKTAPSFARSPKSGVRFELVLTRCREMGERGEKGDARPREKGNGERGLSPNFLFPLAARILPRPVLPFHDRASKTPLF